MLCKLMKYDFKASFRVLLPVFGGTLALALVAAGALRLLSGLADTHSVAGTLFSIVLTLFAGLAVVALLAGTLIALLRAAIDYYSNVTGAPGYLTFTLPVTPAAIIGSKMLCALVCTLLGLIVTGLAFVILVFLGTADAQTLFGSLIDGFCTLGQQLTAVATSQYAPCLALGVLAGLLWLGQLILRVFTAITLGAKYGRSTPFLATVGFFLIINFVLNLLITGVGAAFFNIGALVETPLAFFTSFAGTAAAVCALIGIVLFFLCRGHLSRNLNLQ